MSEFKRQHPVAAITKVLQTLRELLIPIILVFFFGGGGSGSFFTSPVYIGGFLLFIMIFSVISWWRYMYRVDEEELRIEYGVIIRKRSYIPRHRIQVINISSGILQRMFGLVSLNVQTAGGSTPGATINALTRTEADWIKENLSRPSENADTNENDLKDTEPEPVYALSWKNLIIAGSTSGSFGIALSIVGTIMSQMQVIVDDDAVFDYMESFFKSDVTFIVSLIFAMILFAWLLSIVGTILAHANFNVFKREKEILITRGLFEKRQITIPYSRIQAVRIQEGVLRQPFGFCTIYVDSAGYGEQSGQSAILFPLLKKSQAWEFIRVMVPEYDEKVEKHRPPTRALRRYIIRTLIPILFIGVALYWFTDFGHYILLLIPFGVYLGYMRFRIAAAGVNDTTMIMRYRNLAKTTAIAKRYRIQSAEAWDNWFQRRRNLKSLSVNIASSDTGATFSARDFEADTVLDFVEWVEPKYLNKTKSDKQMPNEPDPITDFTDWLDAGI